MIGKGHQVALVTLDERKSKLRLAWPLDRKTAEAVTEAILTLLDGFKDFVHTLTFDNGKEFARHETLAKELNCHTYFAKPYHSWERGQNENANGLLRQYFPKTIGFLRSLNSRCSKRFTNSTQDPGKAWDLKPPMRSFASSLALMLKKSSLMHLSLEFILL
jgi:IS30 family transposase